MRLWRKAAGEVKPPCLKMECPNFSAASMTPSIRKSYDYSFSICHSRVIFSARNFVYHTIRTCLKTEVVMEYFFF